MSQNASELFQLGNRSFDQGDYQRAVGWFEQALDQARRDSQTTNELDALDWLCVAWGNLGDHPKMAEMATRLLARARQLENDRFQMVATHRLCDALAGIDLRRRWPEIRPLLKEGLTIARRLGDSFWEVYHLKQLGAYAVHMREAEQGYAWLQEALNALTPQTEHAAYFRYSIYAYLSTLMQQREEWAEAVRYAEMAIGAAEQRGRPSLIADARLTLAQAERGRGELGTALEIVEAVLPQARERGWQASEQWAEYLRAEIERALGHPDVAITAARQALTLSQAMQKKEDEVECFLSLGQALLATGEREEAVETIRRARRLSQERDYEDHFHKAEELLQGVNE